MDTAVDALNQRRKPSNEILAANERAALVLVPSVWDRSYRRVPLVSGRQWHDLVAPMLAKQFAPPDVRAAIAGFLNECQKEARPFARIEELGAIRAIFPNLDIPDADLEDAVASEAAKAGFHIDRDNRGGGRKVQRKALDCWDNEGGAPRKAPGTEAQR